MAESPSPRQAHVISDPYEVDLHLASEFGLARAVFMEAARRGNFERRRVTSDHAPGADGYYFWNGTLQSLRAAAREAGGWHNGRMGQIPVVFNNDESVAIAVSAGDDRTGRAGDDPSTKNVKGFDAQVAIDRNPKLPFGQELSDEEMGIDFWYDLLHVDHEGDVWAEVARPRFRDASGRISSWAKRIIIGRVGPDDPQPLRRPSTPTNPAAFDPVVKRRRSA